MSTNNTLSHAGFVAIVGRPNVGKSTLLNALLGQKISITARKPQTTRHAILGVKTVEQHQLVYVDTPGLHQKQRKALNRHLNRTALNALHDVDVVLFVVDATRWNEEDEWIASKLANINKPVILALNKVDKIENKALLLPKLEELNAQIKPKEIVPISARKKDNLTALEQTLMHYLPEQEFLFDAEEVTNRSVSFLTAELVREQLIRHLGQELPHSVTVAIEAWQEQPYLTTIHAIIWVEKEGQKAIVIGDKGSMLKQVGTKARLGIEKMLEKKVLLKLWVRIKENWSDDERALMTLGYHEGTGK